MSEEHSAEKDAYDRGVNDGIRLAAQLIRDHTLTKNGEAFASFLEHRADRATPPAKPSAPDLDDPIDEYRQAQLERSNEARGIVR